MKGLSVQVYRWTLGDCTANGITSKVDSIILVDDAIKGCPFEVKEDEIFLVLVRRHRNHDGSTYVYAEPRRNVRGIAVMTNFADYGMMGGNFVYSCDSRFPMDYPIPVHDRFESPEVYEAMSR